MLLLVELARLDAGVRNAEPVDRASHLEEHLWIVGAHELRAHDPRVRPVGLLDQDAHGGLTGHDVVVTEQEEGGSLDEAQRNVRGVREAGALAEPAHERSRQVPGHPCGGIVVGSAVDHEDGEVGVVLRRHRREGVLEPGSRGCG